MLADGDLAQTAGEFGSVQASVSRSLREEPGGSDILSRSFKMRQERKHASIEVRLMEHGWSTHPNE